ncbi:MAG: helix-hairpin-helix domain-containing protein [Nitrososphaerota archaeon]
MSIEEVKDIGPARSRKLAEHGVTTLHDLVTTEPHELAKILGVTVAKAKEIVNNAKELLFSKVQIVETAKEAEEFLKKTVKYISTGSREVDKILGGGVPTMSTTAFVGHAATGKTQMVYTLIANTLKSDRYAAYIETEPSGDFIPRIREICVKRGIEYDPKKILVVRADKIASPHQQLLAYEAVWKKCRSEGLDLGLLAVDSFSAKIREFYTGREMLAMRSQEVARHMGILQQIAAEMNCAVVLTGQVMSVPDLSSQIEAKMRFSTPMRPYGGEFFLHTICNLVLLEQVASNEWEATVLDSPTLPRRSAKFRLTDRGIEDL